MSFVVPSRYCGPPESGNGGWVSGHLARLHPAAATGVSVRLMSPPPLDRELMVVTSGDGPDAVVEVRDGELAVARASAAPGSRPGGIPAAVDFATAEAAGALYDGLHNHPFPTCYSCGTAREPQDALCLRPGPVGGRDVHAAAWRPSASTVEDVWAALDCPGAWALGVGGRPMVLGTLTAWVDRLPVVGDEHVVVSWAGASEGRKHQCGTALYAGDELLAHAEATWIAVDPTTIRPA